MEINSTLIVQMIHFFIAYGLLKKFLFKPVFYEIEQEDQLRFDLMYAVESRTVLIAQRERALREQWQEYRKKFAQKNPLQTEKLNIIVNGVSPDAILVEVDSQKINQLADTVTSSLLKRLKRVC